MTKPLKLWADIPPEQRVDEAFLRRCMGARGHLGEQWVAQKLSRILHPRCLVATPWGSGSNMYRPCGAIPNPGEMFCPHHGGARLTPEAVDARELRRLQARRARLVSQAQTLATELAGVDRLIARLDSQADQDEVSQ